jgi:hypothetical protein
MKIIIFYIKFDISLSNIPEIRVYFFPFFKRPLKCILSLNDNENMGNTVYVIISPTSLDKSHSITACLLFCLSVKRSPGFKIAL